MTMNPRATLHAAVVLLAIFVTSLSMQAQSDSSQSNQTPPDSAKPIQVTGCLRRANDGGFYLSDQDGRKWILSSTTASLAQHVMHSVTVTGKPIPAARSQIGRNPQAADSSVNAARPMDVLSLKMLSPSCTR